MLPLPAKPPWMSEYEIVGELNSKYTSLLLAEVFAHKIVFLIVGKEKRELIPPPSTWSGIAR